MALMRTFTESFDSADNEKWVYWGGGESVTGGQLVCTPGAGYAGAGSQASYDLTGSFFAIEVPQVHTGQGQTESSVYLCHAGGSAADWGVGPRFGFTYENLPGGGPVLNMDVVTGSTDRTTLDPYNAATHRFWRLREAGGTIYWDTSDGVTWTNRRSVVYGPSVSAVWPIITCGKWGTDANTETLIVDNINIETCAVAAAAKKVTAGFTGAQKQTGTIGTALKKTAASIIGAEGIRIGETTTLAGNDGGANTIRTFKATLSQTGTLQSMSIHWNNGVGLARLGVYANSSGAPGALLATTAEFAPVTGWQTQPVVTPIALTAGDYWLAFNVSSAAANFDVTTATGTYYFKNFTYAALPTPLGTPTGGPSTGHWSVYATLTVAPTGTVAAALKKAASASITGAMQPKGTIGATVKKAASASITGAMQPTGTIAAAVKKANRHEFYGTVDFAEPPPPPPAPKVETLTDNFASQNNTLWTYSAGASIVSGQLSIICDTHYYTINSVAAYDLTGSSAVVQIPSAANGGAGAAATAFALQADGINRLTFTISGGDIEAYKLIAGVKVISAVIPYSATDHKWLRIRESGGTVYWDASTDGISWSNLTYGAPGINITALHPTLWSGADTGSYTAVFDDFNLPPINSGTIATAVRKATASLTGSQTTGAPHGTIAATAKKVAASSAGEVSARGSIAGSLTEIHAASIGTMHPKGTIGAAVHKPRAALTNITTATSGVAVPFPVPGILGPPVNTAQGHYGWQGHGTAGVTFGVDTTNPATNPKLMALEKMLLEGDPVSRAIAADDIVAFEEQFDKKWIITIYDYLWRPLGELGDDVMEMTGTDPRNNVPTLKIKVKGTSQHIDTFKNCMHTMVGITVEVGALRHAYYVDSFDWEYQEAEWVGTAQCRGIWDVLSFLQVWANFLLPIQAQIPSHAIFIGPIVTCINVMIAECALRIQLGLWEFVNNALSLNPDIRAWFGTLLLSNGNFTEMLKSPIYVSVINPLIDTSPLIARTVRFESCAQVIQDITRAYGVDVSVNLWLPGDEQPDEWTKRFAIIRLDQPTYVVKVVDRSQIEGPTKTILDSILRTAVDILGSFFGDIGPLVQSVPGMQGVFVSPLLGIKFVPPWAVVIAPDIGEKGSVATCKLSFHTPRGWQHIIGGRSPKWLNDLMNALFGYILDAASIFIGIVGIPSDLLSGLLNNAFLAFQLIEHFGRRAQVGPYHPGIEVMHPTPTAPYNIECVSGDTVIQGPDGDERIDVLAKRGGSFRVWSVTPEGERVAATAILAFKKGTTELFEYTLDDGRSIKATHAHRFLTSQGFVRGGDVTINTLFATVDHHELPDQLLDVAASDISDTDYEATPATDAVAYRRVVSIQSVGVDDFYDMAVPGWENYSANGFWNHNTVFGFINALWDSRGYMSGQFVFRDGDVYTYGKDIFRGGLVSLVFDGRKKLFTDYVENCYFRYTPDARDVFIQVGDGKAEEAPLAKHQRFITGVIESINVVTLAPQS